MNTTQIEIAKATKADLSRLYDMSARLHQEKDIGYFEKQIAYQDEGKRLLFILRYGGEDCGYCVLNWAPKYGPFKRLNIPEIQDLNVLHDYRRRGIATQAIQYCENLALDKGYAQMGIGVGLHASYGPAQILYISMGYVPDGQGVNYDRQIAEFGAQHAVDDHLCLMMVKNLQKDGV